MTKEEFYKIYNDSMMKAVEKYGLDESQCIDKMDEDLLNFIMKEDDEQNA